MNVKHGDQCPRCNKGTLLKQDGKYYEYYLCTKCSHSIFLTDPNKEQSK